MAAYVCVCIYVCMYGYVGLCMVMYGYVWLCMYGYICMAMYAFFSELCWGNAMVAYTMPQQRKKEESKRLRGERDQINNVCMYLWLVCL